MGGERTPMIRVALVVILGCALLAACGATSPPATPATVTVTASAPPSLAPPSLAPTATPALASATVQWVAGATNPDHRGMVTWYISDTPAGGAEGSPTAQAIVSLPYLRTDTVTSQRTQYLTEIVIGDPNYDSTCLINVDGTVVAQDTSRGVARCDWTTSQS